MLPTSRNRTYNPDSPVRSADLNDLQDAIVETKHPLILIPLGASCWRQKAGGAGVEGDMQWTFTSTTELVCDLELQPGTLIASVTWSYDRGGVGTFTRRGRRREMMTPGAAADWLAAVADSSSSGVANPVDAPAFVTQDGEGLQLSIEFTFTHPANVFYGAVLGVSRL
jgi:hypothetical protein